MKPMGLRDFVQLAINCFDEGLDSKSETVDKIVDYVEKKYITLEDLKTAFEKMEGAKPHEKGMHESAEQHNTRKGNEQLPES